MWSAPKGPLSRAACTCLGPSTARASLPSRHDTRVLPSGGPLGSARVRAALPDTVHPGLTHTGPPFGHRPHQPDAGCHSFDRVWDEPGLDDRFPKPASAWTNGPVARRNRTLQQAPVRRYHDETSEQLPQHRQALLLADHPAKRRKALRGLSPHEFVCAQHQKNPTLFPTDPTHLTRRLYS
jgi:hypothetical protein